MVSLYVVVSSFVKIRCWLFGLCCIHSLYNVIEKRNQLEITLVLSAVEIGVRAHRTLKNRTLGFWNGWYCAVFVYTILCTMFFCAEAVASYWLISLWRHIEYISCTLSVVVANNHTKKAYFCVLWIPIWKMKGDFMNGCGNAKTSTESIYWNKHRKRVVCVFVSRFIKREKKSKTN